MSQFLSLKKAEFGMKWLPFIKLWICLFCWPKRTKGKCFIQFEPHKHQKELMVSVTELLRKLTGDLLFLIVYLWFSKINVFILCEKCYTLVKTIFSDNHFNLTQKFKSEFFPNFENLLRTLNSKIVFWFSSRLLIIFQSFFLFVASWGLTYEISPNSFPY